MKPERTTVPTLACALLLVSTIAAAEDFKPGVQHICIPNAARDGWECGTAENPPKPAAPPDEQASEPAPEPPPFLLDPERPRGMRRADPETSVAAEVPAAEPIVEPAPESIPAEPMATDPLQSEALADPIAAEAEPLPEPEPLPEAEPAPAPMPVAQPESAPVETLAELPRNAPAAEPVSIAEAEIEPEREPQPAPTPAQTAPVAEAPARPAVDAMPAAQAATPASAARATAMPPPPPSAAPVYLSSLQGARAFASLPPGHFTLQLAHAATAQGFPRLIQQLGIDVRQCYVLRVRRDGGDWYVLAYGSFVDAGAAKSALKDIPPAPGMTAVWPRRVGYLQGEYRP
jgi:hypothetical protein